MKLVVIESPYSGDVEANVAYARKCLLNSIERGECPIASHLLHTQVLDDDDYSQRTRGIAMGHAWTTKCDKVVVYTDLGVSEGMKRGIDAALHFGKPIEYRSLNDEKPECNYEAEVLDIKNPIVRVFDAMANIEPIADLLEERLGLDKGTCKRWADARARYSSPVSTSS